MKNNTLAIAIPTFNRPNILRENLMTMLPIIRSYHLPVYISDDSNNDLTQNMIHDISCQYPNIYYKKNQPSLGHDNNCKRTLTFAKEKYIWYLGDSKIIMNEGIVEVLKILNKYTFDFIITSSKHRNVKIPSKIYYDSNEFFAELAWHATLTGATIYRRSILFGKDYNTSSYKNFIQLGIILDEMLDNKKGLLWINKPFIISNTGKKESYWTNDTLKVFADDWCSFIHNLPEQYTSENKLQVIKSHSDNTGIFGLKNYCKLRAKRILNLRSFFNHYTNLKMATSLNIYLVFILTLIPSCFFSVLYSFYNCLFSSKNNLSQGPR